MTSLIPSPSQLAGLIFIIIKSYAKFTLLPLFTRQIVKTILGLTTVLDLADWHWIGGRNGWTVRQMDRQWREGRRVGWLGGFPWMG